MQFDKNLLVKTITEWRHIRHLTVHDLADLADIPEPTLSNLLAGKVSAPSFETVCAICHALEHPITELQAILRYKNYDPTISKGTKYLLYAEQENMRHLDQMRNEQLNFYRYRLDQAKKYFDEMIKTKDDLIAALRKQVELLEGRT